MIRLITLLLLAVPLMAQGTISGTLLTKRDRFFDLKFNITPAISTDAIRCAFDTDMVSLDQQNKQVNSKASNSGLRQCFYSGLSPATKYYFGPQTSDSTKTLFSPLFTCLGTCTNCGSSDNAFFADNSGLNCEGIGEYPSATTDAEDTDPTPDPPTSAALTTPPTITGTTYTVASNCSDFATKKSDAETNASTGVVSALVLPVGVECGVTSFQLNTISNGGKVLVKSSADDKLCPPNGAITDRTFKDVCTAKITFATMSEFGDPIITHVANANDYYFQNIEIGYPDLDSTILTPVTMNITAINTTTDTITVNDITALRTGQSGHVVVVNLTGTGVLGGYGPLQACNVTSTTPPAGTFTLKSGVQDVGFCASQGTAVDLTGTYGSGGTVKLWLVQAIAGHTTSNGNHALTITGHGIANMPNMPITGSLGADQITVTGTPGDYQIGTSAAGTRLARVIHIEGTSQANCDGLREVTAIAGSNITLRRSGGTTDCSAATTGTVHGHRAISVLRTSSDTIGDYEPRVFNAEVVDANTLELLETSAVGGVTGGYIFWETIRSTPLVQLAESSASNSVEGITFDRVIIDGCIPGITHSAFAFNLTEDSALINSWVESCFWQRVNPIVTANSIYEKTHGTSVAPEVIYLRRTKGLVLDNNFIGPQPFVFDDDDSGSDTLDDLAIKKTYFWNPSWTHRALSEWRNLHFERSFVLEHKAIGARSLHSGNYIFKNTSNFNPSQFALEFSVQGNNSSTPNGPSHVNVEYNIFDGGTTAIGGTISDGPGGTTGPNRRFNILEKVRIFGNLIVNVDTPTLSPGSNTGYFLVWNPPTRDIVIEQNTYIPKRCQFCALLTVSDKGMSGGRVTNNILLFTEGSDTSRTGVRTESNHAELSSRWTSTTGGSSLFNAVFWRGTATDVGQLSEWAGNIHIPGLEVSSSGTYSSKAASLADVDTICKDEVYSASTRFTGLDYSGTNTTIGASGACSGNNVDSLNQRLALVFDSGTYSPISPTYDGKGVNISDLSDAQGFISGVGVTADNDQFDLAFHSPTTAECTVDRAPWAGTWATTWDAAGDITRGTTANGATQSKTFSATGLAAATQYAYRVFCQGKPVIGLVTTAGS